MSDHFYYMSTKFFSDGEVHSYFNPYDSPYDAFINYMNILSDFEIRVNAAVESDTRDDVARLSKIIAEKEEQIEKLEKRLAVKRPKDPERKTKKATAVKKATAAKKAPATKKATTAKKVAVSKKTLSEKTTAKRTTTASKSPQTKKSAASGQAKDLSRKAKNGAGS